MNQHDFPGAISRHTPSPAQRQAQWDQEERGCEAERPLTPCSRRLVDEALGYFGILVTIALLWVALVMLP